jgi:glycosyltransferase involved in cell wall biosynthesis
VDVEVREIRTGAVGYIREARTVIARCEGSGPGVLHTHGFRADVTDGGPAALLGYPTVSTVHGFTGGGWKTRAYERLQLRVLRWFGGVAAVSRPIEETLVGAGVSPERVALIPNVWTRELPAFSREKARTRLGIEEGEWAVGWVGRLSPEKGADVLIAALAHLDDPEVIAVVVGDGPDRTDLKSRAAAAGVGERIRWAGVIPHASRLFPAFDTFALTSRTEGTPMVLFEAMSCEIPVVATAVGGVPDVVGPGEALLIPADDPVALAGALGGIRGDPGSARDRSAAARARLDQHHAIQPWLSRYEDLYRATLARSKRSGSR